MVECHRGDNIFIAENDGFSGKVSKNPSMTPGPESLIKKVARSGRLSVRNSFIPNTNGRRNEKIARNIGNTRIDADDVAVLVAQ